MGDINSKFSERVQESDLEKVKILLEKKADVNYINHNGLSAIKLACINNDIDMIKLLIEYKTDLRDIMETAVCQSSPKVVKLLLESKAGFSSRLVYKACNRVRTDILQLLIDYRANVNMSVCEYLKDYPIIRACEQKNVEMVKILVENKADVNVTNYSGDTPLSIVYRKKNKEIMKILAKHGAYLYEYPVYKYWDDKKFVKELIEDGAEIPDDCILKAMEENDTEMVEFLVEHGGVWPKLETMLSFSSFLKYYLEKTQTSPNSLCKDEYMIINAIRRRFHETTRILLEAKADISVVDCTGSSLLEIAGNICDAKITSLLLSHGATFSMLTLRDFNQAVRKGDMKKIMECLKQGIKPDNNFLKYATESKNIKLIEMACRVASGEEIDFEEEEENTGSACAPDLEENCEEEGEEGVANKNL